MPMYSDDEQIGFGCGGGRRDLSRSPEPRRGGGGRDGHDDRRRSRSRGEGRAAGGKGGGKGGKSQIRRSSGRELPKLNSVHKGSVVSIQSYGAFVKLGDGSQYKDGLLHVSRISASGRIEAVSDVLAEGDGIWVKVCEVNEDAQKYSVDMRYVRQKDGEDLDPNNTQADSRGAKGGGKGPEPIRIGAVQPVTCSKCGARGHSVRECWAGGGKNYNLVDEMLEQEPGAERTVDAAHGVDPKIVKAALDAYMKGKAVGGSPDGKKKSKKDSKDNKKEKKALKKQEKKAKKQAKKEAKRQKKIVKKNKKATAKDKGKDKAKAKERDKNLEKCHDSGKESKDKEKYGKGKQQAKDEGKASKDDSKPSRPSKDAEPGSIQALLGDLSSKSSSSSSSSSSS